MSTLKLLEEDNNEEHAGVDAEEYGEDKEEVLILRQAIALSLEGAEEEDVQKESF